MSTTDDGFELADRLFGEALDLPPAERPAFLDAAFLDAPFLDVGNGEDRELRRQIERLLAAAGDDDPDLEPGGAWGGVLGEDLRRELLDEEPADAVPGSTVGRYRLLSELGRGGMAVVYLAERLGDDFRQQVAVKLLKRGLDSEEIVRRFEQERQILAAARHPGLARLLDGGIAGDGRPFLVMEHVLGRPIDEHCDAERLSVPKRVRLFLQVARAVEAAHRSLVVHRDIKPSNVLVTADGHAKLLDFGIAKLLGSEAEAVLTGPRSRLLTPAFASPEQLAGEPVTTASDVYQLGLLLLRLLAGASPPATATSPTASPARRPSTLVRALDPEEARAAAAARSSTPPRLARELAGDLDTIVLMALRPEPERRYGSAGALIADLERHLDGRPVAARPDTLAYRTAKFARRHRAALATATAAAVLLVAVAVAYGVRLAHERDRAELAARRATATAGFLRGLFRVASPSRSSGEQLTARELLDRGAARLAHELTGEPGLRADLLVEVGGVYRELALYEEARARLEEAVALRRLDPGPERLDLATALQGLAEVKLELAARDEAEALFTEALAIREAALGAEHPETALSLDGLGRVHAARSRFAEAMDLERRALAALERALGPDHEEVGRAARHLAHALRGLHLAAEAKLQLERALGVLTARLGADHAFVAGARLELAETLSGLGERAAARREYEAALPVLERVYGREHPALAHAYTALADILTAPGPDDKDPERAILYYRQGLAIRERALGPGHPQVADSLLGLGRAYQMAGRDEEARQGIGRALVILEAHFGAEHVDLAVPLYQLARLERRAGRRREALALHQRVIELRERALGPRHGSLTLPLYEQAQIHRELGRPETAEPLLRRILDASRDEPGAEHGLAMVRVELGLCLTDLSRFGEAEAELLPLAEAAEPGSRRTLEALVTLYRRWGRAAEAAKWEARLGTG